MNKCPGDGTYLGCTLFAFISACKNIQWKSNSSSCGSVFLWTLINVNSPQIYIDARRSP